jgi:hypothetical protein
MKKIIFSITTFLILSCGLSAQVAIESRDIMVVYAGIPATFKAGASGEYTDVIATPSTVLASQFQIGQMITVSASGKDKKGNAVSLGRRSYKVKKAPKPDLYWNGIPDGGQANKNAGALSCRYGDNVPFDPSLAQFEVVGYTITLNGIKGSLEGSGSSISASHMEILKSAAEGSIVTISVRVSGPYEGLVNSSFKI